MANTNYYYRAVVRFGSNRSGVMGDKYLNIEDCKNQLNHFIHTYMTNSVTFIGIQKYNAHTNEPVNF